MGGHMTSRRGCGGINQVEEDEDVVCMVWEVCAAAGC